MSLHGQSVVDTGKRLKIRTACTDDAAVIASILAETFTEYRSLYTTEAFVAMTPGQGEIIKRFDEAGDIWVVELDAEIVGTVSAVHRNDALYIRSLAILPAAQGLRIGERLLKKAEDYAIAGGFKFLTLSTGAFLLRALQLYDRFGFTCRGIDDFHGTRLIAMEKRLGSRE